MAMTAISKRTSRIALPARMSLTRYGPYPAACDF
jgi:hypothetical protein